MRHHTSSEREQTRDKEMNIPVHPPSFNISSPKYYSQPSLPCTTFTNTISITIMLSYAAIILAVALPLVAGLIMLFIVFRRQRHLLFSAKNELSEINQKLAVFPNSWTHIHQDSGFGNDQVKEAYQQVGLVVHNYVEKWLIDDATDARKTDSAARIESLLFPSPRPTCPFSPAKDASLFSNPHSYTAAEITALLERKDTRGAIAEHILVAVMLRAVSFEGSCKNSLLSFSPWDIHCLETLHNLIQGVDCMIPYFFLPARLQPIVTQYGLIIPVLQCMDLSKFIFASLESIIENLMPQTKNCTSISLNASSHHTTHQTHPVKSKSACMNLEPCWILHMSMG